MTPDQHLIDDFESLFPASTGAWQALGVSRATYYRWRKGDRPVPEYIRKSIAAMTYKIEHDGHP